MVYFGGFFAKLGYFAGFSLYTINFVVRISEAAMKGVGDIIFHNLGAQWRGTPSHCDFSFFSMFFTARISEAASCVGGAGVGGHDKYDSKRAALSRI